MHAADHAHRGIETPAIDPARMSDLIGAIYDCAVEPARWTETLALIGEATDCFKGMITVADLETTQMRNVQTWNYDPAWLARQLEFREEIAGYWKEGLTRDPFLDEPVTVRNEVPEIFESRYYHEWARPQGIADTVHIVLLREPNRFGDFALARQERFGPIGDREIGILKLLSPHIRRAITISDLLDTKSLENAALFATLDSVAAGVVIVGAAGRILHANEPARAMLDARAPIVELAGRINARHPDVTRELLRAIEMARGDEAGIGRKGIGVPLVHGDNAAAVAHVLPLAKGARTRLVAEATAAVFVVPAGTPLRADLGTVGRIFGLTPAETRMLEHLSMGMSLADAAGSIGIGMATAKTHSLRIFAKLGVARQAELMALVQRLVPPSLRQGS